MSVRKWMFAGALLLAAGLSSLGFAQKPGLKFNPDKKFKIVQFTDLHVKWQDPRSDIAFERMNQVLDDEKPDLVIFTGDIIYSKPAFVLYCIDSNTYSTIKGVKGYDYIKRDQIDWYCKKSAEFTRNNGGEPVPSLAFFHIALPEFNQAASDENAQLYGIRREKACAPALNSGLFTAIKENGDVMGIFVGHDHDDDYAVCWHDVLLAYGRFTGGPTEYIHIPNGARVIELNEGVRTFKTWIRTKAGVEQLTTYPDSFVKE